MAVSTINKLVSSKFRFRSPFILTTDIVLNHSFICCQTLTSGCQKERLKKESCMRAFCVNIKKRKLPSTTSKNVEKTLDHDTVADEVKKKNVSVADHVKSKREIERERGDVQFVKNKEQLEFREQCFATLGVGAQHLALKCKNHELLSPIFRRCYRYGRCTGSGRAYSDFNGPFCGNTTFTLTFSQLRCRDRSRVWPLPALEQLVLQYSSKRNSERRQMRSSGSGHDDGDRPEDEQKMKNLKAAIVYIPNPVRWAANKLNKLRSSLDSSFSEEEFQCGAWLAILLVANMVEKDDFKQLNGLVLEEVISWLKSYKNNLSAREIEVLKLNEDDIALLKITDVLLSAKENEVFVDIDSVCFALKQSDKVPRLAEIGMSPNGWQVLSLRIQNESLSFLRRARLVTSREISWEHATCVLAIYKNTNVAAITASVDGPARL